MPTPRRAHAAGVVKGKIYLIGGTKAGLQGGFQRAVAEYDPTTDKWTEKSATPTDRVTPTAGVVSNRIYAIGGYRNGAILSTVEEYNPATDMWTEKTPMPSRGSDLSSGVVDGKIYVIGGWPGGQNIRSVVEEYTPEGGPFAQVVSARGKLPMTWGEIKQSN